MRKNLPAGATFRPVVASDIFGGIASCFKRNHHKKIDRYSVNHPEQLFNINIR